MKKLIMYIVLFAPVIVSAEFDQQQMQAMMQKAQEMQACMNNVDRTEMDELEQRGELLEVEVKKLCASGQRAEAQSKAVDFTNEMANSSSMKELRKCGEMAKEMMAAFPKIGQTSDDDGSDIHICDNLN